MGVFETISPGRRAAGAACTLVLACATALCAAPSPAWSESYEGGRGASVPAQAAEQDGEGLSALAVASDASIAVDDLTLHDIDGSADRTLLGTYAGRYRVVISGRPACEYTRGTVEKAIELSKDPAYKDVQFIVLDVDGDREAFADGFGAMETDRVRFFSSGDESYDSWAWGNVRKAGKKSLSHLPFLTLIDRNGRGSDWSGRAEGANLAPIIYETFGIKGKAYRPFMCLDDSSVQVGEKTTSSCLGFGSGAISWSSSDPKVASVDQEGNVTAKVPGWVTITAKGSVGECSDDVEVYGLPVDVSARGTSRAAEVQGMLELVNGERAKEGSDSLGWDSRLEEAAVQRAFERSLSDCYLRTDRTAYETIATWEPFLCTEVSAVAESREDAVSLWSSREYLRSTMTSNWITSMAAACCEVDEHRVWVALFSTDEPDGVVAHGKSEVRDIPMKVTSSDFDLEVKYGTVRLDLEDERSRTQSVYAVSNNTCYGGRVSITPHTVMWTSSDDSVASVGPTGNIEARGVGTATITSSVAGKSVKTRVEVTPKPQPEPTSTTEPTPQPSSDPDSTSWLEQLPQPVAMVDMYRLYNPYTGEHFYTADAGESDSLSSIGWTFEGVGWVAPAEGEPVYRLYNPFAGDHHYTTSAGERDGLVAAGWVDEGVGWRSAGEGGTPLYRQYNPYAQVGTHNYTTSKDENDMLVSAGWIEEGIGWYGVA